MATRNVVLSQHQHELVETFVESERYQNASEVLREGLRLLERAENEEAAKIAVLRRAADEGWADLAAGRYHDVDDDSLDDFIAQLGHRSATPEADRWRDTASRRQRKPTSSPSSRGLTSSSAMRRTSATKL